jgi:hypothetical protein
MYDALRLDAEGSAKLRDAMIAELNQVGSSEEAARWAKRRYPDNTNRLDKARAAIIDQVFRTKIISFAAHYAEGIPEKREGRPPDDETPTIEAGCTGAAVNGRVEAEQKNEAQAKAGGKARGSGLAQPIDKSLLRFPEPQRVRDREHMRYVAQQSCLVCGPQILRRPSLALCANAGAWAQGRRRLHSTALPRAPSRASPLRRQS